MGLRFIFISALIKQRLGFPFFCHSSEPSTSTHTIQVGEFFVLFGRMLAKVTPAQGLYRHFHNPTPPPFLSLLHPLLFQSWHTHIRCDKKKYFLLAADFGFSSSFLAQCFIITIFIFICCTFSFIPFHFISFC